MNIPAKYRRYIYAVTVVVTVCVTVGNAFGVIPSEAVEKGVNTATQLLAVISAVLAVRNVTEE